MLSPPEQLFVMDCKSFCFKKKYIYILVLIVQSDLGMPSVFWGLFPTSMWSSWCLSFNFSFEYGFNCCFTPFCDDCSNSMSDSYIFQHFSFHLQVNFVSPLFSFVSTEFAIFSISTLHLLRFLYLQLFNVKK